MNVPLLRSLEVATLLVCVELATAPTRSDAQASLTITGRVRSDQGQALTGANVRITESGISVATNAEGRYVITLADSMKGRAVTIRARAIGFKPDARHLTIVAGEQTVDVTLTTDVNRLEEVVIAGVTGATSQSNLPFTVAKVSAVDMPVPGADMLSQLAGKVPGAQITSYSGRPGSQPGVLLRGPKSLNASGRGQDPLFIVDGVAINGSLPDLNPQDIESIEVVKGAAAATLYGSRAGNGVIAITTYRGRGSAEGTQFRIHSEYGQSIIPGDFPLSTRNFLMMDETGTRFCVRVGNLDCARTVDLNEEALRINEQAVGPISLTPQVFVQDFAVNGNPAPKQMARGLFQITPWPRQFDPMGAVKSNGAYASQNIDMTGRSANLSYFASASSFVQDAPFTSVDGFRRQSARLNVDNEVRKGWRIGLTSLFSRNSSGAANMEDGAGFRGLARVPAGIDLTQRDRYGRLLVRSNPLSYGGTFSNPLYQFEAERQTNEGNRFLGDLSARYASEWLTLEANLGTDQLGTSFLLLRDQDYRITGPPTAPPPQGIIERYNEQQQAVNRSLSASATRTFWSTLDTRWSVRYVDERQRIATAGQRGMNLVVPDLESSQTARDSLRLTSSDQSVTAVGLLTGLNLVLRERYIVDLLFRRDGSSLFGANNRWANYARGSFAWRLTLEPWWSLPAISELKLRSSLGTAGGRPRFDAQYESYAVASGGLLSANTLGNRDLRPETTTEAEYGIDAELFNRIGINLTYAHAITKDQLLLVPPSVSSGFSNQWQNAGTISGRSWEASLNIPILNRRDLSWSMRLNYDRNRSVITALGLPPYTVCPGDLPRGCVQGTQTMFFIEAGSRIGTIYGNRFITACAELPAEYAAQCGAGREWQMNDEGLIVWIGEGNTPAQGITRNLWQAERFGCVNPSTGARIGADGTVACRNAGGTINAPNGVTNVWGNAILLRDSTGNAAYVPLGNTLPDYRISLAQTMTFRRLSFYSLFDASFGNDVFNEGRHFSMGEFQTREQDQDGRTVETAKPIAHYWRGGSPENSLGNYGFYNVLNPNSRSVEDASFAKLREASLGFHVGAVRGVGDWTISVTGRNLYTFTNYTGFDPEVGRPYGQLGSGAINGIDAWQYPNIRTFTLSLASRF
jgi:TonB-linked SusC/RagA family outer membrane protein